MNTFTLAELADIVCDAEQSVEAKRLAVSLAYNTGRRDAQMESVARALERTDSRSNS